MKTVKESIAPTDVADTANNVKVLSEEDTKTLTELAEKKIKDENITVSDGEVVFIPKEELPAEAAEIKDIGAGIAYDPNHGLLYIGFDFDSKQGIFYNPKYPWQRYFGFCEIYDKCAPVTMMFYNTQRYKFDYEGKNWMIQVWKGQYGITSGAEIGVYTKSPKNPVEFYACASDEDCLKMSFDLYTSASDFEMRASITCKSEEMAKAFAGGLEDNGYVLGQNYWVDGAVVRFNWDK